MDYAAANRHTGENLWYREYEDYLRDLLDAVEKIQYFIKDLDYKKFQKNDKTQFAVIRALEIIGEPPWQSSVSTAFRILFWLAKA